jgi:hypothetical protein
MNQSKIIITSMEEVIQFGKYQGIATYKDCLINPTYYHAYPDLAHDLLTGYFEVSKEAVKEFWKIVG